MHTKQQEIVEELSYEKFYLENYDIIRQWALQITNYEHDLADELIQDIYLKLYQRQCPQNYDSIRAYIYTCLKNGFNTQIRKRGIGKIISLTDLTDVSAEIAFYDPRSIFLAQDELAEICQYMCRRKETSIAASIFILRFFLGYHPKEISIIIKRHKNAIEARLVKIRREISSLPEKAKFPPNSNSEITPLLRKAKTKSNWTDLIQTIYSHCFGSCPPLDDYIAVYSDQNIKPDREMISHFVSCPRCLDRINTLLSLPNTRNRLFFGEVLSVFFSFGVPFLYL